MESVKKENKTNLIIIIGVVVLIVVAIVLATVFGKGTGNQERVLNAKLKELGTDFYENFYYKQLGSSQEEKEEVLKKFTDKGIKVDLDNLMRVNSENSEELKELFINKKTGSACDTKNTKVIIYPKENFGKNDYKIETVLECGFNSTTAKVEVAK